MAEGLILVVEDDRATATYIRDALEMVGYTVRDALAEAIWTAWVDWARHHPLIAPSLLAPWAELPPDQRQAGYRMAEAAFGLLHTEANTAGRA